jgi:hypothetical protein
VSQRHWALFFIGLLLSTFLGGALRVFFSPTRVRQWIDGVVARRQPKFHIEYKDVTVTLADGLFPGAAVEFSDLKITDRDPCRLGAALEIDRLNIPVPVRSLFAKDIQFGVLSAKNVRVRPGAVTCPEQMRLLKIEKMDQPTSVWSRIESSVRKRWDQEVSRTFDLLDGIRVGELVFGNSVDFFTLHDVVAQRGQKSGQVQVQFEFRPGVRWTGPVAMGPLRTDVFVDKSELKVFGRGAVKEGQYQVDGQWRFADSWIDLDFEIRDLPAEALIGLWDQWKFITWDAPDLTNEWFNCRVSLATASHSFFETPVQLQNCRFFGDQGEAILRDGDLALLKGQVYPVDFHLEKVRVAALPSLSVTGPHPSSTVTGELRLMGAKNLSLKGRVADPQFSPAEGKFGVLKDKACSVQWLRTESGHTITLDEWHLISSSERFTVQFHTLDSGTKLSWDASLNDPGHSPLRMGRDLKWTLLKSHGLVALDETAWHPFEFEVDSKNFAIGGAAAETVAIRARSTEQTGTAELKVLRVTWSDEQGGPLAGPAIQRLMDLMQVSDRQARSLDLNLKFDSERRWAADDLKIDFDPARSAVWVGRGLEWSIDEGLLTLKRETAKPPVLLMTTGSLLDPKFEFLEE